MKSKKIWLTLFSFILICSFHVKSARAYNTVTYPNEVKVQLSNHNTSTIRLQGLFELHDRRTNEKALLLPNLYITVSGTSNSTVIKAGDITYTSTAGFFLKETRGITKFATFTSNTNIHSGATTDYAIRKTVQKVEVAEYIQTFVNNKGETWYNVKTADGTIGWVSARTTLIKDAPKSLSLFTNQLSNSNTVIAYRGSLLLESANAKAKVVNVLDMEDYLKGVVPKEVSAGWHKEALKAQAIAARSYALATSATLQNTTASQVYGGYTAEDPRTNQAVDETKGLLVKYNGKPIQTFFFSTSGGRTANIGDVWNSNQASFPYLRSVDDPYEKVSNGGKPPSLSSWVENLNSATVLSAFGYNPDNTILYGITAAATGANGEVSSVSVQTSAGNKTVAGNENQIRRIFPIGRFNMLNSNWFTIATERNYSIQLASNVTNQFNIKGQSVILANGSSVRISDSQANIQLTNSTISKETDPASIVFNGRGWGHRIGMSQYGAKGFAENGWKAADILKHYYQGTTVER